jgi:pimeloyl-ACP methyl ester carboxylesterase
MKSTISVGCASVFLGVLAAACGADSSKTGPVAACELPKTITSRFDAMMGPLGCTPSTSLIPDPPRGCEGAMDLVASAEREYRTLYEDGGCSGDPPELDSLLSSYEKDFAAAHPFVEHRVMRDGFTIAAREFGAEHAGKGPAVVLMHGFPDNQHLYDRVAPALGESFQTITFDFVGWGASSLPADGYAYTVDSLRADLDAVLAHFAPSNVVPVVHDASGWPGIDWALDNQDTVSALVLLNTTYYALPGIAPPYVIRAMSSSDLRASFLEVLGTDDLMARAMFRAQVGEFFTDRDAREKHLPVLEASLTKARAGLVGLTGTLQDVVVARTAKLDRMRAFAKPVTVAFGEDDPFLNVKVAQDFADVFAGSKLVLIPSANHYVQLDRPDAVVDVIRNAAAGG